MPPPTAPPARPHSAHPHRVLPTGLFRTSSSPRRPASATAAERRQSNPNIGASTNQSLGGHASGRRSRDDWEEEDPWDSSSDKDDDEHAHSLQHGQQAMPISMSPASATQPMPIPIAAPHRNAEPSPSTHTGSGSISTSWVSASYHPTPAHGTPPGQAAGASAGSGSSVPPSNTSAAPATRALAGGHQRSSTSASPPPQPVAPAPTRLPPGGAWEIVETTDAAEPAAPEHVKGAEALRSDADDVLRDPMHLLAGLSLSQPASPAVVALTSAPGTPGTPSMSGRDSPSGPSNVTLGRKHSVRTERQRKRFVTILNCGDRGAVDIGQLKNLAWNGVPAEVRPVVWQLLLGYMPLAVQPRLATLTRKRKEYAQLVQQYFGRGTASLDQQIWHQIEIDVPRTRPGVPLWSCPATQRALERILYVWAIRHPASGYVQGINDLATPFFEVFLSAYVSVDPENFDVEHLPEEVLAAVEADSFWCLTKLLDGIQDHYISQQPGIQRLVRRMGDLIKRIDPELARHFDDQGVEYMQFAFRWMNCLLMREISVKCTIRMWDTYLSEGADAFSQFHLYVCCALLSQFSERLRDMDFQEIIMFLQRLPTASWTDSQIETLLSEAFVLKNVWHGAENHFAGANGAGGRFGMMGR